ncbi:MAG: hypothetical protein NVS3B21_03390 [Acidimicrobiales bacterium]
MDQGTTWWRRVPLWVHVVMLTMLLVGTGEFVGNRSTFLPDEGAVILQAQMLSAGHGWFERPQLLETIDPTGHWYGLQLSDHTARGFAPFAKHPVYAVLCAVLYRVMGVRGIVWLSIFGTVVAAVLSAQLARRSGEALVVPCLWAIGVASPLFFDSFMAVAATLAAALGAAATVCLVRVIPPRGATASRPIDASGPPQLVHYLIASGAAAGSIAAATFLRSEAFLFAFALSAAALATGLWIRRVALVAVSFGPAVGALGARRIEGAMISNILGVAKGARSLQAAGTSAHQSYVDARLVAFVHTWMQPSKFGVRGGDLAVVGVWVTTGMIALILRRSSPDQGLVTILVAGSVTAGAARLFIRPQTPVPGLLLAFPLLWGGVLLISRVDFHPVTALYLGTASLFATAVLATQYTEGGSLEWGGRFFAMGMPLAVPVVLAVVRRQAVSLDPGIRRLGLVAVLGSAVLMSALAVVSLRTQHASKQRLVDTVERISRGPIRPVVLSTAGWMGRDAYSTYPRQDWLTVGPGDLPDAAARVRGAGRTQITVINYGLDCLADRLPGWHTLRRATVDSNGRLWQVTTLGDGPGNNSCG